MVYIEMLAVLMMPNQSYRTTIVGDNTRVFVLAFIWMNLYGISWKNWIIYCGPLERLHLIYCYLIVKLPAPRSVKNMCFVCLAAHYFGIPFDLAFNESCSDG